MTVHDSRLDVLLYAHDGRGFGHVARSAAIGMALRRLNPGSRVCLLTGCRQTQDLIGQARLDWLKLPAYDTEVVHGTSRGIDGPAGFGDKQLGVLRAAQIRQVVNLYRPKVVLVDHTPQGKHKELIPALEAASRGETIWILGVRGIVGGVVQSRSSQASELFQRYYRKLLWYGDSSVIGKNHRDELGSSYHADIEECGYVSRLAELAGSLPPVSKGTEKIGCTIAIPWSGEHTGRFCGILAESLAAIGPAYGRIKLFLGRDVPGALFSSLPLKDWCSIEPFGSSYAESLLRSRTALVFGGYNSLIDILALGIPAAVILRDMQDGEQQQHVQALFAALPGSLLVFEEKSCQTADLTAGLSALLAGGSPLSSSTSGMNLQGAEHAARVLGQYL